MKKYLNEGLGACILALGTVAPIILGADITAQAMALGLATALAIYMFGSSGYFNPAITIALTLKGKISKDKMPFMVLAQVIGSLLGATMLYIMIRALGVTRDKVGIFGANSFSSELGMYGIYVVFALELIVTMMITYVVLRTEEKEEALPVRAILIGLATILGSFMCATITSMGANPARSIGFAFFALAQFSAVKNLTIFILAPIAGSVMALYLHKFLHERAN